MMPRLDPSVLLDGFAASTMGAAVAFAARTVGEVQAPLAACGALCAFAITFMALRQVDARPRPRQRKFAIHPLAFQEAPVESAEQPESDRSANAGDDAAEQLRAALHELRRAIR